MTIHFDESLHPRGQGGRFAVKPRSVQDVPLTGVPSTAVELVARWNDPIERTYVDRALEKTSSADGEEYVDLSARLIRRAEEAAAFFEQHGQAGIDDARANAPELVLPTSWGGDTLTELPAAWRVKADVDASPWGGWRGVDPVEHTPVSPSLPRADTPATARIYAEVTAGQAYDEMTDSCPPAFITAEEITRAYNDPLPNDLQVAIKVVRPDADPGMIDELGRRLRHEVTLSHWFREGSVDAMTEAEANRPEWIVAPDNTEDWHEWSRANADEWEQRSATVLRRPTVKPQQAQEGWKSA